MRRNADVMVPIEGSARTAMLLSDLGTSFQMVILKASIAKAFRLDKDRKDNGLDLIVNIRL